MTEAAADWLGNERSAHSLALTRSARQPGGQAGGQGEDHKQVTTARVGIP